MSSLYSEADSTLPPVPPSLEWSTWPLATTSNELVRPARPLILQSGSSLDSLAARLS